MRTRRYCHGFLECEPGLWLVMVMANRQPPGSSTGGNGCDRSDVDHDRRNATSARRGGQMVEYHKPSASATRDMFRSAVFGRVSASPLVGKRGGGSSRQHRGGNDDDDDGGGGGGGGGGKRLSPSDWVDETALLGAMRTAYETFALMHGPVQGVLNAPVTCSMSSDSIGSCGDVDALVKRGGDGVKGGDRSADGEAGAVDGSDLFVGADTGAGGDVGCSMTGRMLHDRLASARKRLRRAKEDPEKVSPLSVCTRDYLRICMRACVRACACSYLRVL